jgi:hypothetical protein
MSGFYPLSERVGILLIRERVYPASFLTPEEARAVAKLKAAAK